MNERDIFLSALEIDEPAARQAYVQSACAGKVELLASVEALLASHGQSQFLNTPVVEQMSAADSAATMLIGKSSTTDEEYPHTEFFSHGADAMNRTDSDDENPLGYLLGFLQPTSRPDSKGLLAHYEIIEVLGRGAFGIVLKAFDAKLERVVAIKVLAPEMAATSPARKRFLREARASAAIRHECVVAIYAVEEQPLPYLVMEYIPGKTLQQRLDDAGPLPVTDVVRLGRQIAEGLAAAGERGLIHRDIKPGNILLEAGVHERVKITDFGLARAADDASLTQSSVIAGTPMYMAPEQALGKKLDQRADLFSLGSVLYQMASGRPPFRAASTLAVLKRVTEDTPRPITEVIPETPQWLCQIISKLHAKNPDERYQTAQEVAEVLADCERQLKEHSRLKDLSLIPRAKSQPAGWWKGVALVALVCPFLAFGLYALNRPAALLNFPESASLKIVENETTPRRPMPDAIQPDRALAANQVAAQGASVPALVSNPIVKQEPLPPTFKNSIGMEFVIVPKGKSWLGGGKDKLGDREVVIPDDFYLGKYEVTQEEWEKVMGENPSHFASTGSGADAVKEISAADLKRFPVDNVTWDQCQRFIDKLNKSEAENGWSYRLPKEVEWEYACRGGPMAKLEMSAFDYYLAEPTNTLVLTEANFNSGTPDNYIGQNRTSHVGSFAPSVLGLQDMHGNLWEWCEDVDTMADGEPGAVSRGGSWGSPADECNATFRAVRVRTNVSTSHGLRLVRVPADAPFTDADVQRIAVLPAEQQVEEVRKELMRRNPGFDGELSPLIDNGAVTQLAFTSDHVNDISPLRAFTRLTMLDCHGVEQVGGLTDLSPLAGLPLINLSCQVNKVSDLSPLKGMQLTHLCCSQTLVSDLSPLKGMALQELRCESTMVAELSPLKGMQLVSAIFESSPVSDLTPLLGMPLVEVSIGKNVTDLSPLKGMSLRRLTCAGARNLTDLAPLQGMSLRYINLYFTQVSDLSPLKGMPLEHVIIAETKVTNLGLLKDMSTLKILNCGRSITDLSPLKGLALEELHGDFQPARDAEILRSIKTLKKINDKPAGEFWKGGEK